MFVMPYSTGDPIKLVSMSVLLPVHPQKGFPIWDAGRGG